MPATAANTLRVVFGLFLRISSSDHGAEVERNGQDLMVKTCCSSASASASPIVHYSCHDVHLQEFQDAQQLFGP